MPARSRRERHASGDDFDLWAAELKRGRWTRRWSDLLNLLGEIAERDGFVVAGLPSSCYATTGSRK